MPRIVPRAEWGAKYRGGWSVRPLPATEVFVHYPGAKTPPGPNATLAEDIAYVRYLEDIGYQRFGPHTGTSWGTDARGEYGAGISYSLLFAQSGRIFRGHDPARESSHTAGHNRPGMGYCLLIAEGQQANAAQLDAVAWALNEQVRLGEIRTARIDGGHRDVYPTICPTDKVMAQIPEMNARAQGGTTVARPNHATMLKVEAELRSRGLSIYCGPSDWAAGRCRKGKHPHSDDSRHFHGLAVDFGYGAAPINDTEALLVELIMGVYLRRWFPGVDFRKLWNVGPGNHEDHGHVDDMAGLWTSVVRPRGNVRSRDGVDLFVPVRVIPEHVPPINHGLTLAHVAKVQGLLGLHADGYHGTNTTRAVRTAQDRLGILVDGKGGPATLAALLEDAKPKPKPKPKPTPPVVVEPEPEPEPVPDPGALAARVAPFRIAGPDAYATAVTATEWEAPDGPGLILYARDTTDATTAAILAARAGVDALPVPTSHGLPLPVRDRIAELDLGWLFVVGGPASVLDTTVADALTAAGITH